MQTIQNVKRIYTIGSEWNERYYADVDNGDEVESHEIGEFLYRRFAEMLRPYIEWTDGNQYDFSDQWTQDVDDTHEDFLAGTGRI
jgi:hypothetical protein